MVAVPRLHAPHSLAVDVLLPSNQTNKDDKRDASGYLRGNVRRIGGPAGTWDDDT